MKADSTISAITALLKHEDAELQCAAAKVLGALRLKSEAVVKALGEAIRSENVLLRTYATDALGQLGGAGALPYLIDALAASGPERQRAMQAVLGYGTAGIEALRSRYPKAPPELKRGIIEALMRSRQQTAIAAILDVLAECDLDMAKHVCFCFDQAAAGLGPPEKQLWWTALEKFLSRAKVAKREISAVAALRLLRYLALPESARLLIGFLGAKTPEIVVRHALLALRQTDVPPNALPSLPKRLLELIAGRRELDTAQVALEILRKLRVPADLGPQLQRLLNDSRQAVRHAAMLKLAELPSGEATLALLNAAESTDPAVKRMAIDTLARNPAARPAILNEFLASADPAKLEALASVLRRFDGALPAADLKKLQAKLKKALGAQNASAAPLLSVLAHADPKAAAKTVLAKAQALKRAKKFEQAEQLLATAVRSGGAPPELRLQLALLRLKASRNELAKPQREQSPGLLAIAELLREGIPVLSAIKADRSVDSEDVYYIGFHFSEKLGAEREFGGELLKLVLKRSPRSAVGKNAKNKLKLEGMT